MTDNPGYKYFLDQADREYRSLYVLYNEIIGNVNTLDAQTNKRMRKLSQVDKGLDEEKPIEEKISKQTLKFTHSITEFNGKIDDLMSRFKKSQKQTFSYFKELRDICLEEQKNLECLMQISKKLRLMKLVVQKFLNKILRLQSRSNIFPDLSEEFSLAKKTFEKNLKKVIIVLRATITECMLTEDAMKTDLEGGQ